MKQHLIQHLELLTNSKCNMNCSFCFLNKNEAYKIYNKKICDAWNSGEYILNIKKTFEKLNANPEDLESIDLWGGEPSLNYSGLEKNLDDIINFFPNATRWNLYTNFNNNVDTLINFIKNIKILTYNKTSKQAMIKCQFSIDGPPGIFTEMGHCGNWEDYNRNFEILIEKIKELDNSENVALNKALYFIIKPTINTKLYLTEFSTYEGIKNYFTQMNSLVDNLNKKVGVNGVFRYIFPGLAFPYDMTVEDGIKYAGCLRLWEFVRQEEFSESSNYRMFQPMNTGTNGVFTGESILSSNIECSQGAQTMLIGPDGEILHCNGAYIDSQPEYQKILKEKNLEDYFSAKAIGNVTFNPLKMTEEELEELDWVNFEGYRGTTAIYHNLALGMMEEMALAGQIPWAFGENKELALKHFIMASAFLHCSRENCRTTYLPYLPSPAAFRRCFNGVTEKAAFENSNMLNSQLGRYRYGRI